ncbi:hypothetical protein HUS90_33300 [Pseudomonas protegens]|jgi:hypothetical protein|nr:hypothetical protein [Pseudomonas protegens]
MDSLIANVQGLAIHRQVATIKAIEEEVHGFDLETIMVELVKVADQRDCRIQSGHIRPLSTVMGCQIGKPISAPCRCQHQ